MTALIVLGMIALLLLALWFLPLKLSLRYDSGGPNIAAKAGPVAIPIYPRPPKKAAGKPAKKKKPKKQKKQPEPGTEAVKKAPLGGKLPLIKALIPLGLEALGTLRRTLTLRNMELRLTVGTLGKDPAKAAMSYGAGWAAVGLLVPPLENALNIRRRDVQVELDSDSAEMTVYVSAVLSIFLGELLHMALHYGVRALKLYLRTKQKGGKQHGTSNQ